MKHTPTPWEISQIFPYNSEKKLNEIEITQVGKFNVLAHIDVSDFSFEQGKANAFFIVHAVNNIERITKQRDELLEAAKMLEDLMTNWGQDFRMETKDLGATIQAGTMIDKFKKVIDNAEESK